MTGIEVPLEEPGNAVSVICQLADGTLWRRGPNSVFWSLIFGDLTGKPYTSPSTWAQLQALKPVMMFVSEAMQRQEPRTGGNGTMICVRMGDGRLRFFVRMETMSSYSPWVDVTSYCDDDGPTDALSWEQVTKLGGKITEVFNPVDYAEELRSEVE